MNRYPVAIGLLLLCASMAASAPFLAAAASDRPVAGIHTIRADDDLVQLAKGGGFAWMIQLLEWREVEPAPDECFWEYTDWLVRATAYYGLDLVLRLDHPPEWAISPDGIAPVDAAAYAAFAGKKYDSHLVSFQIHCINDPNLP